MGVACACGNKRNTFWGDDMIVGSVYFPDYVELLFWLRKRFLS